MKLDRNEKVTRKIYREELFDVIEGVEYSMDVIARKAPIDRAFDVYVGVIKLAKIRLDCIEKLYQLDNSEE